MTYKMIDTSPTAVHFCHWMDISRLCFVCLVLLTRDMGMPKAGSDSKVHCQTHNSGF